jgi:hypothetical protein
MKISKIVAIATLAVAAGQSVNAIAASVSGTVCAGQAMSATPFGGVGVTNADTNSFVKTGFSVQCSSNVIMNYNDVSATVFGVAAGSLKGNTVVGGNSNGGAIRQIGNPCATTGCTQANVDSATVTSYVTGGS